MLRLHVQVTRFRRAVVRCWNGRGPQGSPNPGGDLGCCAEGTDEENPLASGGRYYYRPQGFLRGFGGGFQELEWKISRTDRRGDQINGEDLTSPCFITDYKNDGMANKEEFENAEVDKSKSPCHLKKSINLSKIINCKECGFYHFLDSECITKAEQRKVPKKSQNYQESLQLKQAACEERKTDVNLKEDDFTRVNEASLYIRPVGTSSGAQWRPFSFAVTHSARETVTLYDERILFKRRMDENIKETIFEETEEEDE